MSDGKIGNKQQIEQAAGFRVDYTTSHLFQLIGYRQRIAQDLLKMYDNQNFHYGAALADFDQCNEKIKQLLGL
jgi:hypothetical protein